MKFPILIILFLLCIGFSSFGQEPHLVSVRNNNLEEMDKGLIKVSVLDPFAEGKVFDMNYYETKHMPMVAGILGTNLVKYTIEKGLASGVPNTPLPYIAVGTFYVKDLSAYQQAIGPNRDAIRADFANYTDIVPVILISEVVK